MEQNRTRDWVLTRLAVRTGGGRLGRRRGQMFQVDWDEVDGLQLAATDAQGTDTCWRCCRTCARPTSRAPCRTCPTSAASRSPRRWTTSGWPTSSRNCPRTTRSSLLSALDDERAADVLEAMDDDDAADLLGEMAAEDQQRLLELMEPEEAAPVRRLMTYADYTAGGMMTSEPVILLPDATVAEALALVRNPDLSPALAAQVFVVRPPQATPTGRFLGTAHIQRLLREPPSALVSGIVEKRPGPAAAGRRRSTEVTRTWRPTTWSPRPSSTTRAAARRGVGRRRARPPAAGGLARRRLGARGAPMADRRLRLRPAAASSGAASLPNIDPEAFGDWTERVARFLGTGRYLIIQTIVDHHLGRLVNTVPRAAALRPVPVHLPDPGPVAAGRLRRAR